MKTGNVGGTNPYSTFQNAVNTGKNTQNAANNPWQSQVDTFTPSAHVQGAADPAALDSLWRETDHAAVAIRKLVASALGVADGSGQGFWAVRAGNIRLSDADRAQAQQLIGEDGFFGVNQTTDRLISFAKALVGGGASEQQIENMRAAVQKGFDQVARMFGGFDKLPDVTRQTHEAVMRAFDEWGAGGATA